MSINKIKEIDSLFNRFDSIYHQIAIKQGLTDTEFRILWEILVLGESCTQTEIYTSICINKQTVNSAIKQLAKKEIIYFENGKGREIKIFLTEKGKNIVNEKIKPIEQIESEIVNEMEIEEFNEFTRIASKYINRLEQKIKLLFNTKGDN